MYGFWESAMSKNVIVLSQLNVVSPKVISLLQKCFASKAVSMFLSGECDH